MSSTRYRPLHRRTTPTAFTDFAEQVVPILRQRGLFRAEYQGATLRDHLDVSYPRNRYVVA
ncbi:hypothetical protein WJ15_28490 [Burkholderia cepacia]|nr:hypothetical protein WJ15_28490 [Burkholderia cepacia]